MRPKQTVRSVMGEATLGLTQRQTTPFLALSVLHQDDNMNKLYEHYLVKKYPKMFRDMYGDPKKTCMAWGCSCGDGWFYLLDSLCNSIQRYLYNKKPTPQVVFHQIKEKFGALRIYSEGGDEYTRGMIDHTEALSAFTCEHCGSQDLNVGHTSGWIQSLCPACADEFKKKIGQRKDLLKLQAKVIKNRTNPQATKKTKRTKK